MQYNLNTFMPFNDKYNLKRTIQEDGGLPVAHVSYSNSEMIFMEVQI